MPGLIPLMLNPVAAGSRSSIVFDTQQKGHSRGFSTGQLLSLTSRPPSTTSFTPAPLLTSPMPPMLPEIPRRASMPPTSMSKPQRPTWQANRFTSIAPPNLSVLPYTAYEWKRSIADLKRQHINRRYQACFTRCREILDNIKDIPDIEPAYLISLHFYAATSMEMCIRSLTGSCSTHRESLIRQARIHYDKASELICQAEEFAISRSRPSSAMSMSSSLHSPSGSVSSRAWTSETAFSSPTASICSSEDLNVRLQRVQMPSVSSLPRSSKKVSFELPLEPALEGSFIRPDSPTLGYEENYFTPVATCTALPALQDETAQVPHVCQIVEIKEDKEDQGSRYDERDQIAESFITHGHQILYCSHLSTLKAQIAQHRASLDLMVVTADSGQRLDRAPLCITDELRELDKKARIERLRKNGWQRKRFDASRYEALCMSALADLSSS